MLNFQIPYKNRHQIVIKPAVCSQRCKDQNRDNGLTPGFAQYVFFAVARRGDQFSCLRKTVRENRDTGQVHAGFGKNLLINPGVCIAIHQDGTGLDIANAEAAQPDACLFAVTASNQKRLPHCQPVWRFYLIIMSKAQRIHAGCACDTVYCITLFYGIYLHIIPAVFVS